MNNKLNFNTKYGKVFFVSDLHFGHSKDFILNPRGYANVEQAKEDTVRAWNAVVTENDIVFNIGDLVLGMGEESLETTKFLIENLRCKKHYFIWGNHNAGVKSLYQGLKPAGFEDYEIYPLAYKDKFVFLGHRAEIVVNNQLIVLDHYPIESWNEMKRETIHIHGHCHCGLPDNEDFRRLDVGWELIKRPIEYSEVLQRIGHRKNKSKDHHT